MVRQSLVLRSSWIARTGSQVAHMVSDGSGTFQFRNVPPGHYVVDVQQTGFRETKVNVVAGGTSRTPLKIILTIAGGGSTCETNAIGFGDQVLSGPIHELVGQLAFRCQPKRTGLGAASTRGSVKNCPGGSTEACREAALAFKERGRIRGGQRDSAWPCHLRLTMAAMFQFTSQSHNRIYSASRSSWQ